MQVTVGANDCPVVASDHTIVRCTMPQGTGSNLPITVKVGLAAQQQSGSGITISYAGMHSHSSRTPLKIPC